jgi:uncharacterized membrane protein
VPTDHCAPGPEGDLDTSATDRTGNAAGARSDDGQVMLLSIAYGLLALLLVTVVICASAVHLARKELLALADLAALEAADAMGDDTYYASPRTDQVTLTPDAVAGSVDAYLESAPQSGRFSDLTVVEATTDDGRSAQVTLRAVADVPLLNVITAAWSDGVVLEVTGEARTG